MIQLFPILLVIIKNSTHLSNSYFSNYYYTYYYTYYTLLLLYLLYIIIIKAYLFFNFPHFHYRTFCVFASPVIVVVHIVNSTQL